MPRESRKRMGAFGALASLSVLSLCACSDRVDFGPKACSREESPGARDTAPLYNRKWVPADSMPYFRMGSGREADSQWIHDALYMTQSRGWVVDSAGQIVVLDSGAFVSKTVLTFRCSYAHPDTCYYTGRDVSNNYEGAEFHWRFGSMGQVVSLGSEEWEILTATASDMSYRMRYGETSPWDCSRAFVATEKVFADTSGGRLVLYD